MGKRRRQKRLQQLLAQQNPSQQQVSPSGKLSIPGLLLNWAKKQLVNTRPIFKYIFAALIGSGAVWQYYQIDIQRENQATEIRKVIIDIHEKIIQVTNEEREA